MAAGRRAATSSHVKDAATIIDAIATATLVGGAKAPFATPCWSAQPCRHTCWQSRVSLHFRLKSTPIGWPSKTVTGTAKKQHGASVLMGQTVVHTMLFTPSTMLFLSKVPLIIVEMLMLFQ